MYANLSIFLSYTKQNILLIDNFLQNPYFETIKQPPGPENLSNWVFQVYTLFNILQTMDKI